MGIPAAGFMQHMLWTTADRSSLHANLFLQKKMKADGRKSSATINSWLLQTDHSCIKGSWGLAFKDVELLSGKAFDNASWKNFCKDG